MSNTNIEIGGAFATATQPNIEEMAKKLQELLLEPVTELKEFQRGCGYRKKGGTYMVDLDAQDIPIEGMPIELSVCPCCNAGIKFSRGFQWIQPKVLFGSDEHPERAGLIWIGAGFYDTPKKFISEASVLGVSRRLATIPRGLVLGETRIYLAHRAAIIDASRVPTTVAGVFGWFVPTKLQYIVKDEDTDATIAAKQKRGIETVRVSKADEMNL